MQNGADSGRTTSEAGAGTEAGTGAETGGTGHPRPGPELPRPGPGSRRRSPSAAPAPGNASSSPRGRCSRSGGSRDPRRPHRPARQGGLRHLLHLLPVQGGGVPRGRRPPLRRHDPVRHRPGRGPLTGRPDTPRQPRLLRGIPAQREDDGDRRAGRDVQRGVPGDAAQAPRRLRRAVRQGHRAVAAGRAGRRGPRPEMAARALAAMVDHSLYLWLVQGDDAPGPERLLETWTLSTSARWASPPPPETIPMPTEETPCTTARRPLHLRHHRR